MRKYVQKQTNFANDFSRSLSRISNGHTRYSKIFLSQSSNFFFSMFLLEKERISIRSNSHDFNGLDRVNILYANITGYLSFSIITARNYGRSLFYSSQLAIILQQWPLPFFATTSAYENSKGEIPPSRHSQTIVTSLKSVEERLLEYLTYTTTISDLQSDNRGTFSNQFSSS